MIADHAAPSGSTGPRPTRTAVTAVLVLIVTAAVAVAISPAGLTHAAASSPPRPVLAGTRTVSLADEGAVGRGLSVFDDTSPAVAHLNPALLDALRRAATAARRDGVELEVNSGWRSADYQERLLREAVAQYGSEKEAERWVATPETSAHVSGDAVDLGPSYAVSWLERHGAAFGLCQIYRNEPWHYELRPGAVDHGCPAMYADPTQDPRMQR